MKVAGRGEIAAFGDRHSDAKQPLAAWLAEVEHAEWTSPQDIKNRYRHASFVGNNRVVFNIKGNKYRVDAMIDYKNAAVLIKRAGTHAEYNAWKF